VIFVATKKGRITNLFSPFSFVAVFGSGIWNGQNSVSGINPTFATLVARKRRHKNYFRK